MTLTNERRRVVVARLRAAKAPKSRKEHPELTAEWYEVLCAAVGGPNNPWFGIHALMDYLAGLIEPEERTCHIAMTEPGWWECDACSRSIDWDSYHEDDPPNCSFCPNCGARVVE